jgi:hypothetical protein
MRWWKSYGEMSTLLQRYVNYLLVVFFIKVEVFLVALHHRQGGIRLADRQHSQRISESSFTRAFFIGFDPMP